MRTPRGSDALDDAALKVSDEKGLFGLMMKRQVPGPSMTTIGAMFLRSVVLLPVALLLGVAYLSCLLLPIGIVSFIADSEWSWAGGMAVTWMGAVAVVVWWWRRPQISEKRVIGVTI